MEEEIKIVLTTWGSIVGGIRECRGKNPGGLNLKFPECKYHL